MFLSVNLITVLFLLSDVLPLFPQEFEKDDDSNGHIDFITSASVSYYNFLLGRFPFRTNFWKCTVTNEAAFCVISRKEDNLEVYRNFRKFYYRDVIRNNTAFFHTRA